MAKSFETSIAELEESVRLLESGELSLDASIKEYKKGMKLAKFCSDALAKAEQEIFVYENNDYKKFDEGENNV